MKRLSALLFTTLLGMTSISHAQQSQRDAAIELKKHGYVVLWCEDNVCVDIVTEEVSDLTYPTMGLYVSIPDNATLSDIVLMELLDVVTGTNDM